VEEDGVDVLSHHAVTRVRRVGLQDTVCSRVVACCVHGVRARLIQGGGKADIASFPPGDCDLTHLLLYKCPSSQAVQMQGRLLRIGTVTKFALTAYQPPFVQEMQVDISKCERQALDPTVPGPEVCPGRNGLTQEGRVGWSRGEAAESRLRPLSVGEARSIQGRWAFEVFLQSLKSLARDPGIRGSRSRAVASPPESNAKPPSLRISHSGPGPHPDSVGFPDIACHSGGLTRLNESELWMYSVFISVVLIPSSSTIQIICRDVQTCPYVPCQHAPSSNSSYRCHHPHEIAEPSWRVHQDGSYGVNTQPLLHILPALSF